VLMRKNYVVAVGDRRHTAEVARDGERVELRIDGGESIPAASLPVLGGRAVSVIIRGRRRLIHLSPADARGGLRATLDGWPIALSVLDELRAQAMQDLGTAAGSGHLTADIPGLVVDIRVAKGQLVQRGEPLIVVEAMKMQNELTAGVTGTVERVAVAVGQSVNPGDVLVVIEPQTAD
jgi:acetyl/propionyl-CoA carboxylase alpha subunit